MALRYFIESYNHEEPINEGKQKTLSNFLLLLEHAHNYTDKHNIKGEQMTNGNHCDLFLFIAHASNTSYYKTILVNVLFFGQADQVIIRNGWFSSPCRSDQQQRSLVGHKSIQEEDLTSCFIGLDYDIADL